MYYLCPLMKKVFILLLMLLLSACQQKQAPVELSVYYWKTSLSLSPDEQNFIKDNAIQKLYVRYCDVALREGQAVPVAPIEIDTAFVKNKEIIPVIYLKNKVFLEGKTSEEVLAKQLNRYIAQINTSYGLRVKEIQLDCDWTLASKERYFKFVEYFRAQNNYILSATIRLHQVKHYTTTGIPKVDYGVLMYYNMGNITPTGANSIYDHQVAKAYLSSLKAYPLELKVALPIFSWGVHSVAGEVTNLVGGLTSAQMDTLKGASRLGESNCYLIEEQLMYKGRLWQKGDILKVEEISPADLYSMKKDLFKYMKRPPKEIILYDLNTSINNYEKDFFKNFR